MAEIVWSGSTADLLALQLGVSNDDIVSVAADAAVLGIDCPLGWPRPFTDLLIAARAGTVQPDTAVDAAGKQLLAFRRTDAAVHTTTGRWPLSVSTDRIAYPAMRCAGLLARLAATGRPVRRSGIDSLVAEVYPAAAMRIWGLPIAGYKVAGAPLATGGRASLLDALISRTGWLNWGDWPRLCADSHDALDAVVCAIVAGAVHLGRTTGPAGDELELAEEEGWIHLPDPRFLAQPR
jgi:predicted nuclease with RNAse H fold